MERLRYLDAVAGLLMIRVVILHCFQYAGYGHAKSMALTGALYFGMPWFFFKAGMFYRHKDYKDVFSKGLYGLIVPLVFFSWIGFFLHAFRVLAHEGRSWGGYVLTQAEQLFKDMTFQGNQPLWFLFVLFMVRIIYNASIEKVSTLLLAIICVVIPLFLYHSSWDTPYYLASVPAGVVFYLLGNKLKNVIHDRFVVIISAVIYIGCAFWGWNLIDMHWNICVSGHYYLWIPTSLAGIILINDIFRNLPNIRLLEWLGKHSMEIFVTHTLVLEVAISIFKGVMGIRNIEHLALIFIISEILTLPLLIRILSNEHFCWLIGRSK